MYLIEIRYEVVDWIYVGQDRIVKGSCEHGNQQSSLKIFGLTKRLLVSQAGPSVKWLTDDLLIMSTG
jgi:hypothetical protein